MIPYVALMEPDMATELTRLINDLLSDNPMQRAVAAENLCHLGDGARGAAVPLVRASGDPSEEVREWAVGALEAIGAPDVADVAALAALLADAQPDVGYWAATLLGRMGERGHVAVEHLGNSLSDKFALPVRQRSAWALGQIGPAALDAVERLKAAAASSDDRLARLAAQAIERIGG